VALAEAAEPVRGVRLVGVDGPSGAGKSTFARALAARLGSPLIETDDFMSWFRYRSWWPRFAAQVLDPLAAGRPAVFQQRDWRGDEFGTGLAGWRTVGWHPVVVVEGVASTQPAVADRYAVRILVRTPAAVRLRRGTARDGEDHRPLWIGSIPYEDELLARDGTERRAHLVIDGAA
jgi:hypothetical protein